MTEAGARLLLMKEFKRVSKNPVEGFSAGLANGDPFEWEVLVIGPPDSLYEGGYFKTKLSFPKDYPGNPPVMYFISEIYHPNIYKDGKVCISILHPPGDDKWGYEEAGERWRPVHTVESILLSVISMLSSPNTESPANIDASVDFKDNPKIFKRKVFRCVRKTQEEM